MKPIDFVLLFCLNGTCSGKHSCCKKTIKIAEQPANQTSVWMVDKLVGPEKLAMSESFSVTGPQTELPDFWSYVSLCDIILFTTVFII